MIEILYWWSWDTFGKLGQKSWFLVKWRLEVKKRSSIPEAPDIQIYCRQWQFTQFSKFVITHTHTQPTHRLLILFPLHDVRWRVRVRLTVDLHQNKRMPKLHVIYREYTNWAHFGIVSKLIAITCWNIYMLESRKWEKSIAFIGSLLAKSSQALVAK